MRNSKLFIAAALVSGLVAGQIALAQDTTAPAAPAAEKASCKGKNGCKGKKGECKGHKKGHKKDDKKDAAPAAPAAGE